MNWIVIKNQNDVFPVSIFDSRSKYDGDEFSELVEIGKVVSLVFNILSII